jgi:hypothetical protein
MGNLADKRRLREEQGELIYKGDAVISEKDEMMFIPFIKSGSPDETRPWLYKGFYRMPDGNINFEAKRYDGLLELTIECAEKHKEYLSTAVEAFTKKVYDHSAHPVESITVKEHDTEMDILKSELEKVTAQRDLAREKVRSVRGMLE